MIEAYNFGSLVTNEELVKQYETLIDLFSHKGWKLFQEELSATLDMAEKSWPSIEKTDQFFILKGNLQTLKYYENYEMLTRIKLDELEQDMREQADEEAA